MPALPTRRPSKTVHPNFQFHLSRSFARLRHLNRNGRLELASNCVKQPSLGWFVSSLRSSPPSGDRAKTRRVPARTAKVRVICQALGVDEVVGEGASVLAEHHPPGEERTQLEAVRVGLTQFDQAGRRGEADYSPADRGSSSLLFPSGFDVGAPDLLEALEPLADASSACGDGTSGGRAEVIDVDDTANPQCEQATGCMTGLSVPQGSAAPLSELDSSKTAAVDADTLQEEGKAESNHFLRCHRVKNDEQGTLMPQGPPDVSNCDFDGGNPNIPVSEADTIISSHATASAVSSDMEVSKMEVDAATILQHCKDGLQGEAMHSQGASAVFSFSSDVVKFSDFESDNGISAIGNVDVVEETVLKTEVDSFPVSEWQQGNEEDNIKEEVLVPQSSYTVPSSSFDGDLLNCDAFEIANAPTTAVGDNAVHLAVLKMDVDTAPIVEGKQVTCEESDVLMHVSSISESAPEKVGSCECVIVAIPGDNDAMKVDMSSTDIDKLGNGTLPICEQTVDVVVADISISKYSSSEFPFDSDHGLRDNYVLEPDVTTISHDSADAVDHEAMQIDADADDTSNILQRGGRRKRGRPSKTQVVRTSRQKEAEVVCFICFDGGVLVVCDHRGCPKVYHPSCVNRDEAFFRAKGRWTCGWHICSSCERTAHYMCFSCTYSLCKGCIKESGFICLRQNKGFCEACMSTVMLIETKEYGNGQMITVDFDDRSSFEYLFKDYYLALKAKLSLTLDELMSARNPIKRSDVATLTNGSGNLLNPEEQQVASSDSSSDHKERTSGKIRKRSKKFINDKGSVKGEYVGTSVSRNSEWATDELLEFVAHMRNGDTSALSQFDVQALLLDYIKKHNLRDRRRKSQIICDSRLGNLFGKERVGHFEMLKLLESHFLIKEVTTLDSEQGGVVDPDPDPTNAKANNDPSTKLTLDKRRKAQKKVEDKELLNNLDDYAAIDVHNISLMYLRRNLMEDLIDNDEFEEKVIGSFVRIRISGLGQRQDMYRLVQVIGSGKATEQYKSRKGTTDVTLEILNLNKKEIIRIDIISNQEFTEEECKRLRQSIKCGFIGRLTVGEVLEKAMSLQHVRVNDLLESEKSRVGHLRDRASEKGRRKELRECVEKLQLLNTPEERDRRLNEAPDIHTDPHMDPDFESAEEQESDVGKHDFYDKLRESSFTRNGREVKSPGKGGSTENWSSFKKKSNIWESNRNTQIQIRPLADSFSGRRVDATDFSLNQFDMYQPVSEAPKNCVLASAPDGSLYNEKHLSMQQSSEAPHGNQKACFSVGDVTKSNTSESEKIWHYKDPSARIQGPFSMTQLCKWSTTGYFPPNLMIWRTSDKPEDSITLTDAMAGKFEKDLPEWEPPPKNADNLVDVSPTPFSAKGNSESVQRGSKENTQKAKPSSWPSTNMDVPSSTSPNDAKINIGRGQNKPIESQPNGQCYVNSQFNRNSTSNQLSSTITKISLNGSYQLRNDSSNVPTLTSQPSSQGWSNAKGFANGHMTPNVSVHDMASGWVTTTGGMEETVSLRNSTNSLTELGLGSTQFVPDQAIIQDGGKSLPVASVLEPEMKRPQAQEGAATETSFSEYNQAAFQLADQSQILLTHDQNYPGKHLLTTQVRSSEAIGPTNDPIASAQTPDANTPSVDSTRKLFVPTDASESILAQRSQTSTAPNHERMNPTNFEIPVHWSNTNNQMPSSNLTPYGWSSAPPDSAAASNNNIQLLCSNGSNPPSSQFGSNASVVSVKPTQFGFVNGSNIQNTTFPVASQNPSTNPGSTQGTGSWTQMPQGNMNIGWGMVAQNNMNMPWGQTSQTPPDLNMGLGVQNQVNPIVNPGWAAPARGNTNMNAGWVAPAMGNTNQTPGWGAQLQGKFPMNPVWAMFMTGQPNPSPGWVAPIQSNTCHNMDASAEAINMNPAWGPGQGDINLGQGNIKPPMNQPVGNPQSFGSQQPQAGDRRTGQGNNSRANDSKQLNPRLSWNSMQSGGSSAPPRGNTGICRFHEMGHCKKGASCNYSHS